MIPLVRDFIFASPSRSTAAPPEGTTSGGAEDLLNLTALYTLVSEQGKKIGSLESELQAHKLLFKDVMGKLVKRVKFLESKLKARGRNVILSESDNEEDEEQEVDSLIKLAKAAAIAADTSSVPADATHATEFPPSSSIHTDAFVHGNAVPTGTASDFSADPSNKGKSPMVEEDPPIKERSFRQMEEDRLGAEAARKLYEEEQAELARVQEEMKKKRQEDVINSAKYYTDADWSDIMGQVHANQGLTADLLGPDVNEDNFAERMVALIAERRRKFEAQRLQEKRNKPMTFAQQKDFMRTFVKNQSLQGIHQEDCEIWKTFTDDQLKAEFDKIRNVVADLQSQNLKRSLKRPGADVEQPKSKKSKSSAAPQTLVSAASHQSSAGVPTNVHQSLFVASLPSTPAATPDTSVDPPVSRSSGPRTRSHSSAAGIKTYSTRRKSLATRKMSSSEVDLTAPDNSFIQVLSNDDSDDSDDDSDPLFFWHVFAAWEVVLTGLGDVNALYFTDKSSKYFTHLREIMHLLDRQDLSKLYGMVVKHYEVNPLADTPYPLSASLMKKMLKHKLEVEIDGVGNDMTYAGLGYKRFRGKKIDEEYERDCEIRIRKLKQDFKEWGSEVRKKEQAYNEEQYAAARRYMLSITCDDMDDSIPLGDIIARYSTSKAITPDLLIEEPDNSLNIGEEHLDTIPATKSDEVIKSSVENLVPIPREFEGISDDTCDAPTYDNNRVNVESDLVESLINHDTSIFHSSKIEPILEEFAGELAHIAPIPPGIVEADFDPNDDTSSDDDSFENIVYVDASPSYIEYDSFKEVNDVEQEEKEFDLEDIFQIQDVILREKLLNVHRLISNIESLKVNSTPDRVLKSFSPFPIPVVDSDAFFEESDTSLSHLDNSLPEFETFSNHTEETRSGSTTTHANYSLPEYDSFLFEIEPDQEGLISIDNSNEPLLELPEFESFHFDLSFPRPPPEPPDVEKCFEPEAGILITKVFKGVSKPHDFMADILPTLPTLVSDLTFILFLSSFLSFGSEDTIFDPGIITFPFSYLEPVAFSMEVSCSKCCSP
ncbi:hypothetical protein Tco_0729401 [Tanacetum coccineum]|uniref:Uncharacterized protein n=1 Tax=Tanacetum coccineum TaxID=301880 RepID=A0ABQ4YPR2_9ASTR